MHYVWLICLKDLRQRFRDRTGLIVAIVAPLALTALMGLSLAGSQGFRTRLAIADLDGSPLSRRFIDFVLRPSLSGVIEARQMSSRAAAEAAVERRDAECAVVLDPGFAKAASADRSQLAEILVAGNDWLATQMMRALIQNFLERAVIEPAGE